jgi:carbonic anhydrase
MRKVEKSQPETRRKFLAMATSSCAALGSLSPRRLLAQTELTPDAALSELLAGNQRFVAGRMISHEQDLSVLRQHTAEKQEPFVAVLSCSDSRVPTEIIFDQSIGHIFIVRVAGNIVTPEVVATIEYGAAVLGVKAVLVLGHADCGAVKAAMEDTKVPGNISALYQHIQPALSHRTSNLEAAIKANAEFQCDLLLRTSSVLSGSVSQNNLKLVAGYYDISDGRVMLLGSYPKHSG